MNNVMKQVPSAGQWIPVKNLKTYWNEKSWQDFYKRNQFVVDDGPTDSDLTNWRSGWKPEGLKYDAGKPRMDLLDSDSLVGLAQVLTFGANKYAAHNWRGGINYSRLVAAMHRHLAAINRGEDVDPESGLPHVDHLGCCWMFLSYFMKHQEKYPTLDDRYK
jgi:hypothetical protein